MITTQKQQAIDKLQHQKELAEVYLYEPSYLEHMIDLALMCKIPAHHRIDLEFLEDFADIIVGRHAEHHELRTAAHHEAVMAFMDYLLAHKDGFEEQAA